VKAATRESPKLRRRSEYSRASGSTTIPARAAMMIMEGPIVLLKRWKTNPGYGVSYSIVFLARRITD
jgi:hypothetical protein